MSKMLEPFFEGVLSDMPQSTWSGDVVTWFKRTTKFVHAKKDYFEKTGLGTEFVHATKSPHPETYGLTLVIICG